MAASAPAVEVVLATGAGTVSGKTTPGATVALLGAMPKVAIADAAGAFTIRSLPPGAYRIYAWANADKAGYLDAEYMKSLEGKGTAVTIAGAEEKKVAVAAIE